tara:strand:+ start:1733 stop:1960 length:228 start_codon:yes stop_codon:yes gene_type:complete
MVRISSTDISLAALNGIIEAFVLREGTDYGHRDYSFFDKCRQVRDQVDRGEVELWYDENTESVELIISNGSMGSR